MKEENSNELTRKERNEFWARLKNFYPNGKTTRSGMNQYFNFEYAGLQLRVDVYIQKSDRDNYGGSLTVSFNTGAFSNSGFIIGKGEIPDVYKKNDKRRIYFFNEINLKNAKNWDIAIKWICGVVVVIASLYRVVNEK